jgi:hypothetical protein
MYRLSALAAILIAAAAPAEAGLRATYAQPDGQRLVIDVADNGDARIGEVGKAEYGLLLADGFYMVSNEGGAWQAARLSDVAAAIDQVLPPIFRDIFTAGSARKPPAWFRIDAKGERTVAGRSGKVYAVAGMNDGRAKETETFVMSDDPALKPIGRAMEQFMNAAMVPAAAMIGPAAADIVAETRAIFALGTPLDAGGRFTLTSIETVDVPAAATTLPTKPQTTAELVALMKASMTPRP